MERKIADLKNNSEHDDQYGERVSYGYVVRSSDDKEDSVVFVIKRKNQNV